MVRLACVVRTRLQRYEAWGWHWQQTQMTDRRRAERLWLALAVAMLWMVSVGTEVELVQPDSAVELPELQSLLAGIGRKRPIRLFRLGWRWLLARAIMAQPLPLPQRLVPEPWPMLPILRMPFQETVRIALQKTVVYELV